MAISERTDGMQRPDEPTPESGRRALTWRLEYTLLLGFAVLMTAFTVAFFYFGADVSGLKTYGYAGLFLINFIGAASILLPSPAAASVFGGGAFLNDFLGLPAFFWVGLVAGLGETVGELSGYAAGYGGRIIVEERSVYKRIHSWMQRHGSVTMFVMSVIPNPLFDLAGVAAGATQMPIRRFFVAVLLGKVIKDWYMAGIGGLGAVIFTQLAA
ncbi:MAG: YqaA family protein [Dehalococcoidia bacterium]